MSNHLAIATVTATLQKIIKAAIQAKFLISLIFRSSRSLLASRRERHFEF
jgi:hypothetical protein